MVVVVTPRQYAQITEAALRAENTNDAVDVRRVRDMLALCCLENGGDFSPSAFGRIPTTIGVHV